MCLEVESLRIRSIQIRGGPWHFAEAHCAALLSRRMLPEELMFSPAGSTLTNHLTPYLFVSFRSRLGSRPVGFCCQQHPSTPDS